MRDRISIGSYTVFLRPLTERDRPFVESVYFDTQRWIIDKLFGWRGDDFEHTNFRSKFYKEQNSSLIIVDGEPVGWIAVARHGRSIHLDGIYFSVASQNQGIGTALLRELMREAKESGLPLTLSTAKINPAVRLYERLGFVTSGSGEYKLYMTWWPMGDFAIAPARERDAQEIARLHHIVRDASMPYLPKLHTVDETAAYFKHVIARRTTQLAKTGDLLVGYCAYGDGWLDHLYVLPNYQRLKIGSALLRKAMTSCPTLKLWVFQKNHEAIGFYENAGFKLVRETDGLENEEREPDALYAWDRE
jgi:ribosomal protein S18 acetylase RimI-like enzyme